MSPVREAINLIIFRMGGFLVTVLENIWFPKHCNLNASCHRAVSLIKSGSYRLARSFMEQKQHKLCWWKDRSKSLTAPNSRPSLFIARYRFAQIPLMTTSPTEVAWSWSFTEDELAETESKLLFNDGTFNQSVKVTADFKKKWISSLNHSKCNSELLEKQLQVHFNIWTATSKKTRGIKQRNENAVKLTNN